MRKIIVSAFISLDGVMQAPGGPDEDPTGGFEYGGWAAPLWDDELGAAMGDLFDAPFDLLLGRRTYDIFAAHWPYIESDPAASTYDEGSHQIAQTFNSVTKYVATHAPETLSWQNSEALGADVAATLRAIKTQDGPRLLVQGSSELIQTLFAHDLIDEIRLLVFPIVLGKGKRLFRDGAAPAGYRLTQSTVTPSGAVIAGYERAGEVTTGSFAMESPSDAELERRRKLQ